jgi:hypothetical protein
LKHAHSHEDLERFAAGAQAANAHQAGHFAFQCRRGVREFLGVGAACVAQFLGACACQLDCLFFQAVGRTGLLILSDIADRADSLEEKAIELARARAEELRNARRTDAEEFADATATLEREMARLMSIRRLRSRRKSL